MVKNETLPMEVVIGVYTLEPRVDVTTMRNIIKRSLQYFFHD
jgi:hypothetical protein